MATGDLWVVRGEGPEATTEFRTLLQCCANESYSVVAVNRTLTDVVLTAKDVNNYQPVEVDLRKGTELSDAPLLVASTKLQQLSRLTLQISEPRFLQQVNDTNKILGSYDVVALRPLNQKIFHSLCTDYDFYDILSFDLSEKLPFTLKRNQVYEAIRKGKYFELQYGGLFDSNKKRVCLTNCINIIKATKGKNLIVSSGQSNQIYHRSPIDICSLLVTLGLSRDRAMQCLNVEGCIRNARYRRAYKGIVSVVTEEELKQTMQNTQQTADKAIEIETDKQQTLPAKSEKPTVREAFKTKHMKKLEKLEQKLRDRPVNKQLLSKPN